MKRPDLQAKLGVRTFGQALKLVFGMFTPEPAPTLPADKNAARKARQAPVKVAARNVPRYRAVPKPAHTRPGCKAMRKNREVKA